MAKKLLQNKINFKIKEELVQMVSTITTENGDWLRIIQKGRETLNKIASVQLNVSVTEDLWNKTNKTRKLIEVENRLRAYFHRLSNYYLVMDKYLTELNSIKDNTCRMLSRTRLWKEDEVLVNHNITRKLNITQLSEFLEFLHQRYDAEWEVKDMVFREIQVSTGSSDLSFLVEAWNNCSHTGGTEFEGKFKKFNTMSGRRVK